MQDRLRQRRQDHFGASFRPEWDKKFRSGPSPGPAGPSRPFAASSTASPSSNNQSKVLSPAVRPVNATGNHNHSVSLSENGSSSSSQTNVPASNNNNASQAGKNNSTQQKGNSNGYGGGGAFDCNRPFNKKLAPQQNQQSNGSGGGYNSNFNRPRMARKVQAGYRPRDMAYDGGKTVEV